MTSLIKMFRSCFGKPRKSSDRIPQEAQARGAEETAPEGSRLCHAENRASGPTDAAAASSADVKQDCVQGSIATANSARQGDTASGLRTRLHASKLHDMDPEKVVVCDAAQIMSGLRLKQHELGRGTYGIVVTGTYWGVNCAVKVMLSTGLDRAALRELLLGPSLVHPHIVSTFTARAAHLTHSFFDLLEGDSLRGRDPAAPRVLQPLPIQSGDGFGDPLGLNDGMDPLLVLHQLLHALGAETGKMVVVVVQEYCDRGNLDNAVRKQIFEPNPMWGLRLARRTLLRTAGEMARGLLHLHVNGVIHGDLKPANVLLSSSHEDRRGFAAKLGDFGLAHVLPDLATSLVTKSWGSVAYMAPEAFDGKVSLATDVWAFGVCLWEMLTGQRPYRGMGQEAVIRGLQDNTLALPWPEGADMTDEIIALGRRCLSHLPADRPTMEEIANELVSIERAIRQLAVAGQGGEAGTALDAAASGPSTPPGPSGDITQWVEL